VVIGDILQPTHLLFILVVALLVLGPNRLPEVGRALGRGLRDFRHALNTDELRDQMASTTSPHSELPSFDEPTEQSAATSFEQPTEPSTAPLHSDAAATPDMATPAATPETPTSAVAPETSTSADEPPSPEPVTSTDPAGSPQPADGVR
jgi:TatA/E family protein of Tat protein translocase